MGVGRGYALPLFDKMLPKDVPFTTLESGGTFTPGGLPVRYLPGMGSRERTIQPRIDDDFDTAGMQFSVRQYSEKDRLFTDGVKYGVTAFAGQVERVRGTETNSLFIAEAAWSPQLAADTFYRQYAGRICGPRTEDLMYRALHEARRQPGTHGYYNYGFSTMGCCDSLAEVAVAHQYALQADALSGPSNAGWKAFLRKSPDVIDRFTRSIRLLSDALENMRAASALVAEGGRSELAYLVSRTEFYRDFMSSIITMRHAYLDFDRAFRDRPEVDDDQFRAELQKSLQEFETAREQVQAATRKYAEIVDHPSELGVLYQLNVRAVLGFDLVCQWMRNVVAFHTGKPYMSHVPWERLFASDLHFVELKQQ